MTTSKNLVSAMDIPHLFCAQAKNKKSKYVAVQTIVDNRRFDSKKEAKFYGELKFLLGAGEIKSFNCQVRFPIEFQGSRLCTYVADFVVYHKDGSREVIDVKGYRDKKSVPYRLFLLKKKLLLALYNIDVKEV
jgi:hypothetical protein